MKGILISIFTATVSPFFKLLFRKTQVLLAEQKTTGENPFPCGLWWFYDATAFISIQVVTLLRCITLLYISVVVRAIIRLWSIPVCIFVAQYQYNIKTDWTTIILTASMCTFAIIGISFYKSIDRENPEKLEIIYDQIYVNHGNVFYFALPSYLLLTVGNYIYFFYSMHYTYIDKKMIPVLSCVTLSGILILVLAAPTHTFFEMLMATAGDSYLQKDKAYEEYDNYKPIYCTFCIIYFLDFIPNWYAYKLIFGHLDLITVITVVPALTLFSNIFMGSIVFKDTSDETNLPVFFLCVIIDVVLICFLIRHNNEALTLKENDAMSNDEKNTLTNEAVSNDENTLSNDENALSNDDFVEDENNSFSTDNIISALRNKNTIK